MTAETYIVGAKYQFMHPAGSIKRYMTPSSLSAGAEIRLLDGPDKPTRQWVPSPVEYGVILTNVRSGLVLTVKGYSAAVGTRLDQQPVQDDPNLALLQTWTIETQSPNKTILRNVGSNSFAGTPDGNANGAAVKTGNATMWVMEAV